MPDSRLSPWAKFPMAKAKYKNVKTEQDGIKFDSKREATWFHRLSLRERAGEISNLRRQVAYEIAPAVMLDGRKRPARKYVADFVYVENGAEVVADAKGFRTEMYRFKRHLMRAVHGIEIKEL